MGGDPEGSDGQRADDPFDTPILVHTMKKPRSPFWLASLASLSLAAAGAAQDRKPDPAPEKKAAPAEGAKPPEPARKPQPPQPTAEKKSADRKPDQPGSAGPEFGPMREKMRAAMEEVRRLHEAGKHDEAEARRAELMKKAFEMREKFGPGFGGPGAPPWSGKPGFRGEPGGPKPPVAAAPEGPRKQEPPRPADQPEDLAPDKSAKKRPVPPLAGAPRPDEKRGPAGPGARGPAPFREGLKGKLEEIRRLHREGKHEEARRRMADLRERAWEWRSRFGRAHGPGPGSKAHRPEEARRHRESAGDPRKDRALPPHRRGADRWHRGHYHGPGHRRHGDGRPEAHPHDRMRGHPGHHHHHHHRHHRRPEPPSHRNPPRWEGSPHPHGHPEGRPGPGPDGKADRHDGPQGPHDGPQGPHAGPKGPHDGPKGHHDGPKGPHDGPKGPQDGPQGPHDGPKGPQDGPKGPHDGPKGPHDGPKGPHDGPKGPQDGPKGPQA